MKSALKSSGNIVFGVGLAIALFVALSTVPRSQDRPLAAANLQVSPRQFVQYIEEWSEPEGFFDSDNFISNETSYLQVMAQLQERVKPGGIYLGVGPDQNFSYIAQTQPELAVIVDIRRQNMLQHLLYKALFDLAPSRGEYLSLLFSREPAVVRLQTSFEKILAAVRAAPTSEELFRKNLSQIKSTLSEKYRLKLTAEDLAKIEYIYRTFWLEGLDLKFSTIGRASFVRYPNYEELLRETDLEGRPHNFLASDESYKWLRKFEAENRLIPIVGDFAGAHAFKSVAQFLKENRMQVSTFYTSNVEFYLFGNSNWRSYVENVRALPVTRDAVFIRAYFASPGRAHPLNLPGHRSTSLVQSLSRFMSDYDSGQLRTYWDVVRRTD